MGVIEKPFPSVVLAVMDLLEAAFPGIQTGTELPADLPALVGGGTNFVRVSRLGGTTDRTTTTPTLDVDLFARSWAVGDDVSRQIEQVLLAYPHRVQSAGRYVVLDTVTEVMGPQEVPWTDRNIRRFIASYQISARR